ncbi:necrosis-and ethylene-inducing protein-like protein 1 precursor [Dothidotthia symphoricarpi CBS 119687]|uniref:Necrosis-and ethylene-inducing protein-like protein 1 n=1 Tax=Dothidotthia symphoricarpi CBS 119687 TaxID=1392245 RepID=A0A6A6AT66_9PLEO|nr:necrosis-and ethylene-inducing protein-like protein 1 precursor [Dothidotthia symphoricarpi CBS 119687]KAF2133741.1 necrosis-and ethylene-inducing protein-like protein 1 precursor [Dothidotthia symphoricarpi CBS 119687]
MAVGVLGAPVESGLDARGLVRHDSLNPIRTRLQGGAIGRAIQMFTPSLHIAHGCQPYTAVDDFGNYSGGLQDSGNVGAGCRDTNKGQIYARAAWHGGRFGIMYAYYFPKDQPVSGNVAGGHRHDWESVVVWIDNPANANPRLLGAAASGHGQFKKSTNPQRNGNNVKVEYYHVLPRNQEFQFTNTNGRSYWINDWDAMPSLARKTLEETSFGSANVPFKNANFGRNLGLAAL